MNEISDEEQSHSDPFIWGEESGYHLSHLLPFSYIYFFALWKEESIQEGIAKRLFEDTLKRKGEMFKDSFSKHQ